MRGTTLAVALLILTAGTAVAGDLELYSWRQELTGNVSGAYAGVTSAGTARPNESSEWGLRASAKVMGREFELGYVTLENATRLDGSFSFDGTSFPAGADMTLDAKVFELFPKMTLGEMDENSFKFIFGLKVMDISAAVSQEPLAGYVDETIPIPQIGVRIVTAFGTKARLDFTYKWLDLNISSVDVRVIDIQADLAFRIQPGGEAVVGWRRYSYDVTTDEGTAQEAHVDMEHSGPYVGWRMTF